MNKLKNISKKLVIFLVIFSFLVGIFPLIFNTENLWKKASVFSSFVIYICNV